MEDGSIYEARENDCISSIAFEHGLFWRTIWEHSRNRSLREQRQDPSVLFPGDRVFVPALRVAEETGGTERRHRFRRKGVPGVIRFQLLSHEGVRARIRWHLVMDGASHEGQTDADGILEVKIPPNARRGLLTYWDGDEEVSCEIVLGGMDPVSESAGARKRLKNLGFLPVEPADEPLGPAVESYQLARGLEVTGRLDEATRKALIEDHGC
jgi:hypothetical protein